MLQNNGGITQQDFSITYLGTPLGGILNQRLFGKKKPLVKLTENSTDGDIIKFPREADSL